MPEFVAFALTGLLPLVLVVAVLVLLKRIADGVDRLEATLDRRLLRLEQAVRPGSDEVESRWPPET